MEEETISIADLVETLRQRWWLLLAGAMLAGAASVGLGLLTSTSVPEPPGHQYQATAVVVMEGAETLALFPELVATREVLESAAGRLEIPMSPAQLRDRVSAEPVGNTLLLRVRATDSDPEQAAAMANAVAQSLVGHVGAVQESRTAALQELLSRSFAGPAPGDLADPVPSADALVGALTLVAQMPYIGVPAEAPETPLEATPAAAGGMSPVRNLALGAILGGIVAAGAVIGLEYLRSPIRSPESLERRTRLRPLGILPRWERPAGPPRVLAARDASDPAALEALREVAAGVALAVKARGARVLAVVSLESGEGCSSLVANLGVALANPWRRVVLVDGDLRRPGLHRYFGLPNCQGLGDLLLNPDLQCGSVIQDTAHPGLKVITAGLPGPRAGGLLDSPRLYALWEQLEEMADLVLVDTPPLRATVDGVVITAQAQGAVLLVDGENTRQDTLEATLAKLGMAGTPVLGYVWNRMSPRKFDSYSSSRRYLKGLPRQDSPRSGPPPQAEGTAQMLGAGHGAPPPGREVRAGT